MIESKLKAKLQNSHKLNFFEQIGRITRVSGLVVEAKGLSCPLGMLCEVNLKGHWYDLEVIGFHENTTFLMPSQAIDHLSPNLEVIPKQKFSSVGVTPKLLGRVLNGHGQPIDDKGPIMADSYAPLSRKAINPLARPPLSQPLDVGIRAINGLLPVAKGQRMGLFAGSGVGKSVLLGMMTKFTNADVVVVGLIGERGREVREFIEKNMGQAGLAKSVIVASPSDSSPVERVNGALTACTIAEYFRDQGKDVLLIMDSLTRFAHAKRQMALSVGEPPAHKGYTPSVFFDLAQLIERAGLVSQQGSITAFYTVLAEGDDLQDPVVDTTRSLLDGHIVLSRSIAEMGTYPAIDVEKSISRAVTDIADKTQIETILKFKKSHAIYQENKDLVMVGAYQQGTNPELDTSIKLHPLMQHYIKQSFDEPVSLSQAKQQLAGLFMNVIETSHDQT